MRAGDRELSPLVLLLLSWQAILFHLYPYRDQPSSPSRVLLPRPFSLLSPPFVSFPAAKLRIYKRGWSCAPTLQRSNLPCSRSYSRLRFLLFPFCSPSPLPSKDTANSPTRLISSAIFTKIFTLNELDAFCRFVTASSREEQAPFHLSNSISTKHPIFNLVRGCSLRTEVKRTERKLT